MTTPISPADRAIVTASVRTLYCFDCRAWKPHTRARRGGLRVYRCVCKAEIVHLVVRKVEE